MADRGRPAGPLLPGLVLLALLVMGAVAAPVLAPHDPTAQPDPAAARHRPPGTRMVLVRLGDGRSLLADAVRHTPQGLTYLRLGSWTEIPASALAEHSAISRRTFVLGTDRYGRDLASRLIWASRVSLRVSVLAVALSLLVGTALGTVAGLSGGWTDGCIMRGVDGLLAFPRLFLVLALAAMWQADELTLVLVLGSTGWMEVARLVRGEVMSLKGRDYVLAARASGVPSSRLLLSHLVPAALPPVLVLAALRVGDVILTEAALSFLGFGVQPPDPSWGNIIADGQDALVSAWWVAAFPGVAIVLTVLGFNLVAEGLGRRLDPGPG
jgi:peptide/nickel transport system permease protein